MPGPITHSRSPCTRRGTLTESEPERLSCPSTVFRVSYWREWLAIFVPCQLAAILMPGIAVAVVYPDSVTRAAGLATIVWVIAAGLASIASVLKTLKNVWRCRVRVGPDAIDGYDLLGWHESMPWDWVKA